MNRAFRNSTFARATLYPWGQDAIPLFDSHGNTPITAFDTSKRIGDPTGTWSITLVGDVRTGPSHGKAWIDVINQGDWIVIDLIKNGTGYGVMLGQVDLVSLAITSGAAGEGMVVTTIRGRDAAAPLQDTPIYFNPWDPLHDNASGEDMARITNGNFGNDAAKLLVAIITGLLGTDSMYGGQIRVPRSVTGVGDYWIDLLDTEKMVQSALRGGIFAPSAIMSTDQCPSVWAFLNQWRNPAMNELFLDTTAGTERSRRVYLYLRERPFVNRADGGQSPWFSLPTHAVPSQTLTSATLTRGSNRVNHLTVTTGDRSWLGDDQYGMFRPVVNEESVKLYGLRRLQEETPFFATVNAATAQREWLDLIVSWNALNHAMLQGNIAIGELRPEIRVGQRIRLTDGPLAGYPAFPRDRGGAECLTFYVEAVSHTFIEGESPGGSTVLSVSRGYRDASVAADVATETAKFSSQYGTILTGTANVGELDAAPPDLPPSGTPGVHQ